MATQTRVRWSLVAAFWVVQAVLALTVWPLLFFDEQPLASRELLTFMAGVLAGIMVLQAALLLPAAPLMPGPLPAPGKLVRCIVAGLASGVLLNWIPCLLYQFDFVPQAIEDWVLEIIPSWADPLLPWIGVVVIAPPAAAFFWRATRTGMPALLSIVIAAGVAGLLVGALLAAIGSALGLLGVDTGDAGAPIGAAILLSWAGATPLIAAYTRRWRGQAGMYRVASLLFRGTLIETAAIIPLDVMVRRKTDCYCSEGTFWSLTFCWAAGLIVLGPVVFLLPARRRERRLMRGACPNCGYDLSPTPMLANCPECGTATAAEGEARFSDVTPSPVRHTGGDGPTIPG